MLTRLEFVIKYDYEEKLTYQISSTMHGIIMDSINPDYGVILHDNGLKPFHQYVTKMTEDSFHWIICTMSKDAKEEIIDVLYERDTFELKHKNLILKVEEKRIISEDSYENLIQRYYFEKQPRNITVQFLTPSAFKQKGRYVFMPDVKLIFQSLMNKYDAFSSEASIYDSDVLEHFENYISISNYNIRSVRFYLEGVKIPAFTGRITFHINGPEQLVNLANMLIRYGEYSGIGIKGAIGMGAYVVEGRQV